MTGVSRARWGLYGALLGAALLFNYGLLRVRPQVERLRSGRAEVQELEGQVDALAAASDLRALARLERDLAQVRAALAADRRASAAAGARLANPAEAGELAVQVSALAQEVGLVVEGEEAMPVARGASPRGQGLARDVAPDLARALGQPPFERPLRRWTLRGDFAGLWGFLSRLRTLPWRAVVVRLEVERGAQLDRYAPPLEITMTLAL